MKPSRIYSAKYIFPILLLIFILLRLLLMFSYMEYANGDELAIAIMGKHILEKGAHPYFLYGQHYDGGTSIQSHMMTLPFLLFGINSFSFHLTNLIIIVIFFIIFYHIIKKMFDKKTAFLASLLFAVSPAMFTYLGVTKGHYVVSLIFNLVLFYLFYQIFFNKKDNTRNYIVLGLLTAISWWVLEFVIPLIILFFILWFAKNKKFFLKKGFIIFLLALLIGSTPLIYYNVTHNFANVKQFVAGTFAHRLVCEYNLLPQQVEFGGKLVDHCHIFNQDETRAVSARPNLFFREFPSFFGDGIYGWAYYLIFIAATFILIFLNRKFFKRFFLSWISKKNLQPDRSLGQFFVLIYFLLFLLLFFVSGFADPTHFMPIFPIVCIILALFIMKTAKFSKTAAFVIVSILVLVGLITSITLVNSQSPYDIGETISFLESNNIDRVYTTFFLKWQIIFETNEQIIASCNHLCPCGYRYRPYEETVETSTDFAYILREKSTLNHRIKSYLDTNEIGYKEEAIDDFIIYYDLTDNTRPNEIIDKCVYDEGLKIIE